MKFADDELLSESSNALSESGIPDAGALLDGLERSIRAGTPAPRFGEVEGALRAAFGDRGRLLASAARNRCSQVPMAELFQICETTRRQRSAVEADESLSRAYMWFVFAWGFRAVGLEERGETLTAKARAVLETLPDPLNAAATALFLHRIEEVSRGERPKPLPEPLVEQLDGLERFLAYKLGRMRRASWILEPLEEIDPVTEFSMDARQPRNPRRRQLYVPAAVVVPEPTAEDLARGGEREVVSTWREARLQRASAVARTPGLDHAAVAARLVEVAHEFQFVTDSTNCNSHFCLAVVTFADALVHGLAPWPIDVG